MYKIMLVEDDDKLASLAKEKLIQYNYQVERSVNYENIKEDFISIKPDLVLLDINLPNYDGFYWCRQIRNISKVPIIFVSARFSDMDQVMAIENGGDDYIIKPFSFDILIAKIKGVLRRTYGEYSGVDNLDILAIDGLFINRDKNIIEYKGRTSDLTHKEFRLIYMLANNLDNIVTRDELLEELWDDMDFVDDNTLSVNITRVRKKLDDIGIKDCIKTKRGQGYIMENTWSK